MRLFRLPALAALVIAGAPAAAQLRAEKRVDLAVPVQLAPGQGAIVVGFRRPDRMSMGKAGSVAFSRYDLAKREVVFQPRDAKKRGDTTTYWVMARSGDRKLAVDHAVLIVSPGDYVLFGASPGMVGLVTNTMCLGAPTFSVAAGETVYFGDVTPYIGVKLVDGTRASAMAYSSHPEDARKAVAGQPALLTGFRPAALRNGATYGCVAQEMTAYRVPGVEELGAAEPSPTPDLPAGEPPAVPTAPAPAG